MITDNLISYRNMLMKSISLLICVFRLHSPGLLDWASMGIMSLARVALRAASVLSSVDMELPASSVS